MVHRRIIAAAVTLLALVFASTAIAVTPCAFGCPLVEDEPGCPLCEEKTPADWTQIAANLDRSCCDRAGFYQGPDSLVPETKAAERLQPSMDEALATPTADSGTDVAPNAEARAPPERSIDHRSRTTRTIVLLL